MKGIRLLALLSVLAVIALPTFSSADPPPCPGSCSAVIYYCLGVCQTPTGPIESPSGQKCTASDGSIKDVYVIWCPYCISAGCVYP